MNEQDLHRDCMKIIEEYHISFLVLIDQEKDSYAKIGFPCEVHLSPNSMRYDLFHELRHIIINKRLMKILGTKKLFQLRNTFSVSRANFVSIGMILSMLSLKILPWIPKEVFSNFCLGSLMIIIFMHLPRWVEELDANIFAFRREPKVRRFLYSQGSYSFAPAIQICIASLMYLFL